MTIKQLAERILRETKIEMSSLEIATYAIRKDYFVNSDEEELKKSFSNAITNDIRNNKKSVFRKVPNKKGGYKKGVYKIKKEKISDKKLIIAGIKKADGAFMPKVTTTYIGKGGEYAVMSELLFRGYNANIMTVDDGIDIIASKGTKFFYIQVKTTHLNNGKISPPSIKKERFDKYSKHDTYYIFVVRYYYKKTSRNEFLIFKHTDLEKLINTKFICADKPSLAINILIEEDNFFIHRNGKKENIDYYFNNFELIK